MRENKLTPGSIVTLIAGVVVFVASFLHLFTTPGSIADETSSSSVSSWSKEVFPLYTLPAIFAALIVLYVLIATFSSAKLPDRLLGMTWNQLTIVLSAWATLMMVCFLIGKVFFTVGGLNPTVNRSVGFWLTLLGAIGLLVGSVISARETAPPAPA